MRARPPFVPPPARSRERWSAAALALLACACGHDPAPGPSSGPAGEQGPAAEPDALGLLPAAAATTPLAESPALEAYQRGAALARAGRYDEASDVLRGALAADPARPEIALALGQALVESASIHLGYDTHDRDRMALGIAALERARAQRPGDADVCFWLGQAHYLVQEFEPAMRVLERALELEPGHALARLRLGAIHVEHGRAAEARSVLAPAREALDAAADPALATGVADPEQLEILWGMLLELEDDRAGAAAAYARAAALGPSNENARFLLGTVLAKLGRRAEAEAELERYEAIKARKDEVNALERRAEHAGSDANLWLQVGIARARLGQLPRARMRLRRVLELSPRDPRAHFWLGVVAKSEGRLEDARRNLTAVVRADARAAEPRLVLGQVLLQLGQPAAALEVLREAAALAPDVADVQAARCAAAAATGATEEAAAALAALRASAPDDPRLDALAEAMER